MDQHAPLTSLKGVGEALSALLKKLRLSTVGDLLEYVPQRYEDYSKVTPISAISPGIVTLKVRFSRISHRYVRRGMHLTEVVASDQTGSVRVVWFNQPYRAASLKVDSEYFITGEFAQNYRYLAITNPSCELASSFPLNAARIVPVYRLTKGLSLLQLRRLVKQSLEVVSITETLPAWIITDHSLMARSEALQQLHFPDSQKQLTLARLRIGFEEVFELMLASELNRVEHAKQAGLPIPFAKESIVKTVEKLPFALTDDQRRMTWQILQDMQQNVPMNRLLQGDVGSGKTIVAALSALNVVKAGYQVAFMAPTELLAEQHMVSLTETFEQAKQKVSVALLTSSKKPKEKQKITESIARGETQLVVGTHALFQESVAFKNLGYCIVDEQHRFGVEQRKALQAKAKTMPHVLHMSATPIPRSIALTLYGDMSLSQLKTMPAGRKPVTTEVVIAERREKVYGELAKQLDVGRQAFVVCPQIEEDEAGRLSVKAIHQQLTRTWLKEYSVGLLHGKMKSEDKTSIMEQFVKGELQVLVSTTVIEVGVNVPNATVMVIEGADRFGLAQLHQLRGRVGRGLATGSCYLVMSDNSQPSKRLKVIEHEYNGFKLADYDLDLRGPGALYGTMQHGVLDLRIAKLSDTELINSARKSAQDFVKKGEKLVHYTHLKQRISRLRTITNLN